jgi:hypothetical protein
MEIVDLAATMTVKPAEHFSSLTVQDAETKSPRTPRRGIDVKVRTRQVVGALHQAGCRHIPVAATAGARETDGEGASGNEPKGRHSTQIEFVHPTRDACRRSPKVM